MIRVTLANGASELLEREIEPRRPDETLYDFMLRSAHETTLEARALRALLDAHIAGLAAERAMAVRQRRVLLLGQSLIGGMVASLLIRPDTIGDFWLFALPVAVLTMGASLVLAHFLPGLDRGVARIMRRWRR